MNQCSRNRRRHAAMPFGQFIERRNGRRIAQHDSNRTATRDARRLALSAGLWLGHGSDFAVTLGALGESGLKPFRNLNHFAAMVVRQLCVARCLELTVVVSVVEGGAAGVFSVPAIHFGKGHITSPSGPIPPMCESYTVTSDVSTTILRAGL